MGEKEFIPDFFSSSSELLKTRSRVLLNKKGSREREDTDDDYCDGEVSVFEEKKRGRGRPRKYHDDECEEDCKTKKKGTSSSTNTHSGGKIYINPHMKEDRFEKVSNSNIAFAYNSNGQTQITFNPEKKTESFSGTHDAEEILEELQSDNENYPSDENLHRFSWGDIEHGRHIDYRLKNDIIFMNGPAPMEEINPNNNGRCHLMKNYTIVLRVPPSIFPTTRELVEDEWKINPSLRKRQIVPNFSYIIILYLGSISKIIRGYQHAIQDKSKIWWQSISPLDSEQELIFDVTFTTVTTKKMNSQFRLYAQMSVVSTTEPGIMKYLGMGSSTPFSIYSHSKQYGYTPGINCPICNKPREELKSTINHEATGLKLKSGKRKFYTEEREEHDKEDYMVKRRKKEEQSCKIQKIFPGFVGSSDRLSLVITGVPETISQLYVIMDGFAEIVIFKKEIPEVHNIFFADLSQCTFILKQNHYEDNYYFFRKIGYHVDFLNDIEDPMFYFVQIWHNN